VSSGHIYGSEETLASRADAERDLGFIENSQTTLKERDDERPAIQKRAMEGKKCRLGACG
jgi:hypothetical protein